MNSIKKTIMKAQVLILLLLFSYYTANSQSLSVFNLDPSSFPTIKANFYAFDASGKQMTNLSPSDFKITENGLSRIVTNVTCPSPKLPVQLSSVLTIDVSGSMFGEGMNIAKSAAKMWVNCLNLGRSECAITSFDNLNYLNQDFTTNRAKLLKAIDSLKPQGQTDYDYALINPVAGGLVLSESGHYKRVIILLTDGLPQTDPQLDRIISTAKDQNCVIYSVVIGMTCPKSLKDISEQTGGEWFEKVYTAEEAQNIYLKILATEQDVKPCEIDWESDLSCQLEIANVEIDLNGLMVKASYIPAENYVAKLEVSPKFIYFGRVKPGKTVDTTLKITALNSDFAISNIKIKYGSNAFALKGVTYPINIKKNDSATIKIRYAPTDSTLNYSAFEIETDLCPSSFSMVGGYGGQAPAENPLKLTFPNGGEKFVIGSDTLITWEGISETDTVSLEYSIDSGKTWIFITDTATGLKYIWKNVPPPASNECLVKVKLLEKEIITDATPFLEWERTYGGISSEVSYSICQTKDGGYVISGVGFSDNYNQDDLLLLKLDIFGNLEWQKKYGSDVNDEGGYSVQQTTDGGFIVAGCDNCNTHGPQINGYWILKLDALGNIEWDNRYNGWMARSIQQTTDDGYIVCGFGYDQAKGICILKLDSKGAIEWEKLDEALNLRFFNSIQQTSDKGYIAVGGLGEYITDFANYDYLVLKLDINGNTEWEKTFGGDSIDKAHSVQQTLDGGYIISGETNSNNGDITENKGKTDYWILKLDRFGSIEWQKSIGGSNYEPISIFQTPSSIIQNSDEGYILAGSTASNDGDVSENKGNYDVWIVKLDKYGNIRWENTYGGSSYDYAAQVKATNDGGFVVAGTTWSSNGDVTGNNGAADVWVLKFGNKIALLPEDVSDAVFSIVGPQPLAKNIDIKKSLVGIPKDSIIEGFVSNTGSYKFRVDSIFFRGADAGAFALVSGFQNYILEPGEAKNTEFRFIPNRIGIHQAEIVIITQSDTLIQTIQGEGVAPQIQVMNQIIDFGLVNVGKNKDTLQAVTIKNIGTAPITITKTKHNKPNDYDFLTLAGGGSFTLNPGDTAKLDLRFAPSEIGKTSGTLEFYYEGVGSPAVVLLYGEGLMGNPQINVSSAKFQDLICDNSTSTTLKIQSLGADTLRIKELNIIGPDKSDFSINETLPINLAPDSTKTINIVFETNVPGIKTAALEIKSNADPDSILTIPLTARKDSIALVPNPTTIYLGALFPNQTKDSSFSISNLGTIKTDGKVTLSTNLICANLTFTIDSSSVYKLDFTFKGLPADGNINEKITVWDEVCKYSREVLITGKVVSPQLIGFSATQCKSYSNEYKLTLQNPSSNKLGITSIVIEKNSQLFIIDPNIIYPLILEPYSTNNEVKVTYQDNSIQKFKTAVNCYTDNKFIPVITDTIFAETVGYLRTTDGLINDNIHTAGNPFAVSYDSASQYGKNKFTYSIRVNESANDMDYLTELANLEVVINYNRNVLGADFDSQSGNVKVLVGEGLEGIYSIKSAKETKIDEFNSRILVEMENTGKPVTTKDAYKLLEIDFSVYLSNYGLSDNLSGDNSRTAIISHSINSSDKCISYETTNNAEVTIEKLCADNFRQIKLPGNGSDHFYLNNVIPQPVGSKDATIEYGLGFECQVSITIYDLAGNVIIVPVNEIQKSGTHKQAISRKSLSAGTYFIEMKAGPFKETKKVIVE